MAKRSNEPFIVNDPVHLDREFYSGYDERFLYRKAAILYSVLTNPELASSFLLEEDGKLGSDRLRHALAAEILFTEFHQFESFFAVLTAQFQALPHWVYLTDYKTGEIKQRARQFMDENFASASNQTVDDRRSFLRLAVYSGLGADDPDQESWNTTFDNLWWLIYRMAEKYLEGSEYNSYKHGLRIHSAESALAVAATPGDLRNAFIMNSPHSVTHLDFKKEPGATVVMVQTKQFNPEESRVHIGIMADILANVKRVRLAMLSGAERVEMTRFSQIDKGGLQRLATCQRWSFSA